MSLICEKCGEVKIDGKEHATEADCMASIKMLIQRVRQTFSKGAMDIAGCRQKRHHGKKVAYPLDVCGLCLKAGWAAFNVAHEIVTSGIIPRVRIQAKEGRPLR